MKKGNKRIAWHPAFYAAAEFDLRENKEDLIFEREHQLTKEPLRMDLLIVRKKNEAEIKNAVGHIFSKHNIIEYKGPDDSLNINDYLKTLAYACLYKSLDQLKDPIAVKEITISLFREAYPRALMEDLKMMGIDPIQTNPGIYTLHGNILFQTQIVVMKELEPKDSPGMSMLTKNLLLDVLENFYKAAEKAKEPDDKENIDAILHASGRANPEIFQEAMEVTTMSDFLLELMKDKIESIETKCREEGIEKGREEGMEKGIEKGRAEGHAEGRAEGCVEGKDSCAELMGILLKAGRIDDALRATSDKAYLDRLIEELVIKKEYSYK